MIQMDTNTHLIDLGFEFMIVFFIENHIKCGNQNRIHVAECHMI